MDAFLFHETIGKIKMLKKSLVALAIASVAGAASAAKITVTDAQVDATKGAVVSYEGKLISTKIATTSIAVELEAEYTQNDSITLSFDGVNLAKDFEFAGSINVPATSSKKGITLGKISQSENSVTYRVTAIDESAEESTTTRGIVLFFGAKPVVENVDSTVLLGEPLEFDAASLSNSAKVTYKAITNNGLDLDNGNHKTRPLFSVVKQLSANVADAAKFDGVVDVDAQRLAFAVAPADQEEQTLDTVAPTMAKAGADLLDITVSTGKVAYEIHGDFAFLDTDADTDGIQTTKVDVTGIVANSLKVEADKISFKVASEDTTPVVKVDVSGSKTDEADNPIANSPIATQAFTAKASVDYKVADVESPKEGYVVASGIDAGEWTLNGAVVHVPFMPFRDSFAPIVNVSNTSSQDGDIEVLVYAENNAEWVEPVSYMLPVQAKAQAQTNITRALKSVGIEGDVAFDIIVNAPKDDIEVSALYYNNGDRAVMQTVKQD